MLIKLLISQKHSNILSYYITENLTIRQASFIYIPNKLYYQTGKRNSGRSFIKRVTSFGKDILYKLIKRCFHLLNEMITCYLI